LLHRSNSLLAFGVCLAFAAEFPSTAVPTWSSHERSYPQQFADKQNASVQPVFAFASNVFDGIEKLTALNLQVVKATLAENQAILMKTLSATPDEVFALSTSLAKPTAEKVAAYSRHVREILSDFQGGLSSTGQAQLQQYQSDAQRFVENVTKDTPPGTGVVVTE
jgi:phasin family protein